MKTLLLTIACALFTIQNVSAEVQALSKEEFDAFSLIAQSPQQRRPAMHLNPLLCKIARLRAADMAQRNYFSHVTPEGTGPNQNLVNQGYALPGYALGATNSVESVFMGNGQFGTPKFTVDSWLKSPVHRPDVFGQTAFTASKSEIGIGKAVGRGYSYYVFLSAPVNANPAPPFVTLALPNQLPAATIFPEPVQGNGWKQSAWFGWINDSAYPLVKSQVHGWLTMKAASASSVYYYDAGLGWVQTSAATYPVLYIAAKKAKYRYIRGTAPRRQFLDLKTNKIIKG